MSVLLSVWEKWSLFPSTYLSGLEAFFFLSETESVIIKDETQKHENANSELFIDQSKEHSKEHSREPSKEQKEDLESLRRRAKLSGVAVSEESLASELSAKINYTLRYAKNKSLKGTEEEEEEFSIAISAGARERERTEGEIGRAHV